MPFTPFHLGPALLLGLLFFRRLHFPTFIVANVIIDIEPFLVIVLGLNQPLHGFFHSIVGGSLAAVVLSLAMKKLDKNIQPIMASFKLEQAFKERSVWLACFVGIYLHIFLDSPLYSDINPFYPLDLNPFYGVVLSSQVYGFCALAFLAGAVTYFSKLFKNQKE